MSGSRGKLVMAPVVMGFVFITLRSALKLSGLDFFLRGLTTFSLLDAELIRKNRVAQAAVAEVVSGKTKSAKAQKKAAAKLDADIREAAEEQCSISQLTSETVRQLTFSKDFDDMVAACALVAINAVSALVWAYVFGTGAALTMSVVAVLVLAYICYTTLSVDVAGDGVSGPTTRVHFLAKNLHLVIAAAFGTLFSYALLSISTLEPQPLLNDFGLQAALAAVEEATASLQQMILTRLVGDDSVKLAIASPNRGDLFMLGLALWGGFMAAAMVGPACRFAKLVHGMASVPRWGKKWIGQTGFQLWTARAAFVLPMIVALLQFKAVSEAWGLDAAEVSQLQGGLLLLTATAHAFAIQPLCQAYLNNGLSDWYINSKSGVTHSRKAEIMRARLDYMRTMAAKTALQVAGLAGVALATGVLASMHGRGSLLDALAADAVRGPMLGALRSLAERGASDAADGAAQLSGSAAARLLTLLQPAVGTGAVSSVSGDVGAVFVFVGRFYGTWACLAWSIIAWGALAVHKLGLNQ
ncbi:hypothetical protein FOA52_000962 [Chlamydomonas sp. UWO 241]|nr:hypothetical protein FOA52_000962 [Chlamydomonas sp. UWO 241]